MTRTKTDIANRFDFHPATDVTIPQHETARSRHKALASWVAKNTPESREQSLALTSLEQSLFWTNAAIARHQG